MRRFVAWGSSLDAAKCAIPLLYAISTAVIKEKGEAYLEETTT